jgi:hypothetical protein
MVKLKLDLIKFNGAKPFTAKDGTEFIAIPIEANNVYVGQKGYYLELTLMDNRDGVDQYGNAGFVTLDVGKVRREAGEKGPILGNWKHHGTAPGRTVMPAADNARAQGNPPVNDSGWIDQDDSPPF